MVQGKGVEPLRPCGHQVLSLTRLPVPPALRGHHFTMPQRVRVPLRPLFPRTLADRFVFRYVRIDGNALLLR